MRCEDHRERVYCRNARKSANQKMVAFSEYGAEYINGQAMMMMSGAMKKELSSSLSLVVGVFFFVLGFSGQPLVSRLLA